MKTHEWSWWKRLVALQCFACFYDWVVWISKVFFYMTPWGKKRANGTFHVDFPPWNRGSQWPRWLVDVWSGSRKSLGSWGDGRANHSAMKRYERNQDRWRIWQLFVYSTNVHFLLANLWIIALAPLNLVFFFLKCNSPKVQPLAADLSFALGWVGQLPVQILFQWQAEAVDPVSYGFC